MITPVSLKLPPATNVKLRPIRCTKLHCAPIGYANIIRTTIRKVTAPVKALLCVKVITLLPALKLEVPGTVKAPVSVIAPLDEIVKLLPTHDAANTVAILLVNETLLALLLDKVIAPVNLLPAG